MVVIHVCCINGCFIAEPQRAIWFQNRDLKNPRNVRQLLPSLASHLNRISSHLNGISSHLNGISSTQKLYLLRVMRRLMQHCSFTPLSICKQIRLCYIIYKRHNLLRA